MSLSAWTWRLKAGWKPSRTLRRLLRRLCRYQWFRNKTKLLYNELADALSVDDMPVFQCQGCHRTTNSVCSKPNRMKPPEYCFAAHVNGQWVKGCGFDKGSAFEKAYAMHLITGEEVEHFLTK